MRPPAALALGVLAGLALAVALLAVWGFGNLLVLTWLGGAGGVSCGEHFSGVYATLGARIYRACFVIASVLIGSVAVVYALRMARGSRPGRAAAAIVAMLLGLVPATVGDASALYGPC